MTITVSSTLTTEMESLVRTPASYATVEHWLPEWQAAISGLSAGASEQYAHGHAACVAKNAGPDGGDLIFRCRSGSFSNPQDTNLYISILGPDKFSQPEIWDNYWAYSGINSVMHPAWTANSYVQYGASLACVWSGSFFRVFYVAFYNLQYADFNTTGQLLRSGTVLNLGSSSFSLGSMQLAACAYDEVFFLRTELVEPSEASWHKPVYGSKIYRYTQSGGISGGWSNQSGSTPIHTHAEAALARDGQFVYGSAGNEWGNGSDSLVQQQWGKRPCGGLAANEIDSNTVAISAGFVYYRRYGYDTHSQGMQTFLFYRDSQLWERSVEADVSDYVNERLDYAMFVRGSGYSETYYDEIEQQVKTVRHNFLVWSRLVEPSDYDQKEASQSIPRAREVVYAKFSDDGKALTQYQYLGPQNDLTAASIVVVDDYGHMRIFALGWRSVYTAERAALMGQVQDADSVETSVGGWQTQVNNRFGMSVTLDVEDAVAAFQPGTLLKAGSLVKIYAGSAAEQIQIAQGLIDQITPSFSLSQESHKAKVLARADKGLIDPRSEELSEILPQNTVYIGPSDPVVHIGNHQGYWEVTRIEWPGKFPSVYGGYSSLTGENVYRLKSFPYAYTGGDQGYGYPGMVLDQRPAHKGTWWNDAAWTDLTPMVDGSVEASVRWGDVNAATSPISFYDRTRHPVQGAVTRSNGVITKIYWTSPDVPGWSNDVRQSACMAGLICHAAEMNKKFAFVWEGNTSSNAVYSSVDKVPADWYGYPKPFSASSHTDDTWRAETFDRCDFRGYNLGANKLYLVMSDYDDTDADWLKNNKWIHKVVAGGIDATGLTPGLPADLKLMVHNGTLHCFYRPTQMDNQAPSQWRYAFSYKAGRFGAGRFGIVGRGHAGIQWDSFYYAYAQAKPLPTGRDKIPLYDNYVDFWNIKLSDAVMDRPMEEILKRRCWQGFTPTRFNALVDDPGPFVPSGGVKGYGQAVENLTIDFKVSLSAGVEAGVICRAVDAFNITSKQHTRIGLVVNGGFPGATGYVVTYAVKRGYDSYGNPVATATEYSPAPVTLTPNIPLPVRVSVRGNVYSIWVAGNYLGHFRDDTAGGVWFGVYGSATFSEVRVPELYEVPEMSSLEVNQTVLDSIKTMLGKRAIKGVFWPKGELKLSYFETHDTGPSFMDSLIQSALRLSDRFASIVRVDGAYTWATYASEVLLALGRRFQQISIPDIFHREFCYKEAKATCARLAEERVQATFTGLIDVRVQPEDKVQVVVSQQNIAGHYLVDDVSLSFKNGDDPDAEMTLGTRQSVVL